jgi:hypothetical protein
MAIFRTFGDACSARAAKMKSINHKVARE